MALCGHSEPWLETWPAWGMAVGGEVFVLPTPVPLTDGFASSSLPTLPTPTTDDSWGSRGNNEFDRTFLLPTPTAVNRDRSPEELHDRWVAGSRGSRGPNLDDLPVLPTPTASMATGAGTSGRDGGPNLQTAVSLLPTPRATDGTKGGPNQRGSSGDLMLPSAVQLLPTPNAAAIESTPKIWEARAKRHAANGVSLQRSLSAEMVGIATGNPVDLDAAKRPTSARTPPPSDDGSLC